jgi:hypothetical protein
MLGEAARRYCWLFGPPPEKWNSFYRNLDGTPLPRPPGRETPTHIPEHEIDPITQGLRMLTVTQLVKLLRKAHRNTIKHLDDLCREQIQCVESEMDRRGMEIPEAPKNPRQGKS